VPWGARTKKPRHCETRSVEATQEIALTSWVTSLALAMTAGLIVDRGFARSALARPVAMRQKRQGHCGSRHKESEMAWKTVFFTVAALVVLTAGPSPRLSNVAHAEGCDPGTKIDGSTADGARKKIEDAGFRKVHGLKKSCDSFWHGLAVKDGAEVNVVLTPDGKVMREGN